MLQDISLEIQPGEIVAIMGSSGGGKTTLLRCISGLIRPQKGSISVDGVDVLEDPEEARRHMGMVFQSAALFDYMTVEENIHFAVGRRVKGNSKSHGEIVDRSLGLVGLKKEDRQKMPGELSGGMRKRVGIARAIALSPKVMLYDEPTTGLDPITTYTIDRLIADLRKQLGMTSLIVSHDVSSVYRVADRVAFLHGGHLIFSGTPAEFAESRDQNIVDLLAAANATTVNSLELESR